MRRYGSIFAAVPMLKRRSKVTSHCLRPREVNHGGLAQLYEILLESATEQITATLRLVLTAAEAGRTALLFCKVRRSEVECAWHTCT